MAKLEDIIDDAAYDIVVNRPNGGKLIHACLRKALAEWTRELAKRVRRRTQRMYPLIGSIGYTRAEYWQGMGDADFLIKKAKELENADG